MKRTNFLVLTLSLALPLGLTLLLSARSHAAVSPAQISKATSKLSVSQRDERAFIRSVAAISRFEADASKLAIARTSDENVRAVAIERIAYHNETSIELQRLLHVRGMALPMADNAHRKILNRLGKLSGRRFDWEYLEQVGLKYQREDIRQFEKASTEAADPALKAWVDRQLPTLRLQLARAERVVLPGAKPVASVQANAPKARARVHTAKVHTVKAQTAKLSASSTR